MAKSPRLWDGIVSRLGKFSRKSADQRKRLDAMKSRRLQLEQCEDRLLLSIAPLLTPEEQFVENVIAHVSTTPFDQWDIDWGNSGAEVESNLTALMSDPRWDAIREPYRQDTSTSSLPISSSVVDSWSFVGPMSPSSASTEATFLDPSLPVGGMVMMLMSAGDTTITLSDTTGPIGNDPIEVDEGTPITVTADLTNLADELTEWTINWGDETVIVTPPESGNDWGNGVIQIDEDTWEFTHTYADGEDHQYVLVYAELTDTEGDTATIYKYIAIKGDATLDGVVDGSDATILAINSGATDATWEMGDFNYDGNVNGSDSALLAAYWNCDLDEGDGGVTINDVQPTLTVAGDLLLEDEGTYTFTFSADDPGDDYITSWDIDWGDGTTHATGAIGDWNDLTYDSESNTWTATHTYDDGNDYWLDDIIVTAIDSDNCEVKSGDEGDEVKYEVMVTSLADSGTDPGLELREALDQMDSYTGSNVTTITFDPSLFSSPGTITLNGNQLEINSDVTIEGPGEGFLTIDGNESSRVFYIDTSVEASLSGMTITRGATNNGAGMFVNNATLNMSDVTFYDNEAANFGGGLYVGASSTVYISDTTFTANNATTAHGGGLYGTTSSDTTITGSTFSGNTAYNSGGGVSLNYADATISDTAFSNNIAGYGGGGIYSQVSDTTVENTTFTDNEADLGGGIFSYGNAINGGSLDIIHSDFSSNDATYNGGGVELLNTTGEIVSSRFSDNTALSGGGVYLTGSSTDIDIKGSIFVKNEANSGGGLNLYDNPVVDIINSTIANNGGTSVAGGIRHSSGTLTLHNTIVATNTATTYPNIYASTSIAGTYNLIGDDTGQSDLVDDTDGNQVGTTATPIDPQFLDSVNGNYRLDTGSPAINEGNNTLASGLDTDLDGVDRIIDTTVDIGAYEYGDILVSTTVDEDDGDYSYGDLSLREAFHLASLRTGTDTITFDPEFFVGAPSVLFSCTEYEMNSNVILEVDEGTNVKIDSVIAGSGNLTKDGAGTLIFMDANTYTGTTTISAGTLQVGNGGTSGTLGDNGSTPSAVTISSGADLVFYRTDVYNDWNIISNVLSGSGNILVKSDKPDEGELSTGSYKFDAANSYFNGMLTVSGARLTEGSDAASFGSATINVENGGQIYVLGGDYSHSLTISGDGFTGSAGTLGALRLQNSATWSGDITLAGDARITAYGSTGTIAGNISDGANDYQLTFSAGDGPALSNILLNPTSSNTYGGGTIIAGAIVQLGNDNALPDSSDLQLGDPDLGFGILDLNDCDITLSSITTGQASSNHSLFWDEITNADDSVGGAALTVNNSADCEYGGFLSGNLALVKNGTGTLTLAGSNRNTGTATANAGTLEIEDSYLGGFGESAGEIINLLPSWYSLSLGTMSGEDADNFSDSLSVGSQPVQVLGDWKAAIYASVTGTVSRTAPAETFTFNNLELDQLFRVGTVQELDEAVFARRKGQDVFDVDYFLSGATQLIVLEGEEGDDDSDSDGKDFDDVYWIVDVQEVGLDLTGEDEVDEGSVYTLGIGELIGMTGTVSEYTIDWGDGSGEETYTTAEMEAINFQPTHLYADGLSTPAIIVDAKIGGVDYECLDYKMITVQDVDPTFAIYGNWGISVGTLEHMIVISATDPGDDTITGLEIYWEDGEDPTVSSEPWGTGGITKNTDGTWTATYTYQNSDANWLENIEIIATDEDGEHSLYDCNESVENSVVLVSTLSEDVDDSNYAPGDLCLREALALAPSDATILFDPGLFNSGADSVSLGGTELSIMTDVTIQGPTGGLLTIDANGNSRVFHVGDGSASTNVNLSNLTITGGSAADGGGIYVENDSSITIANSLLHDNEAGTGDGGALYGEDDSSVTLVHCTITDNTADSVTSGKGGGIFVAAGGIATINNTIIAQNSAYTDHKDILVTDGLTRNSDYNLIGIWSDTESTPEMYTLYGEIGSALDPEFVDDGNDDYRLDSESPAINAGENSQASELDSDFDGNARIFYDTVDIGAYEYTPTIWYWDTNGATAGFGNGNGTWSTGVANWTTDPEGKTDTVAWSNDGNRLAVFSGTAGAVTISGGIVANSVQFLTSGYTISDGNYLLIDQGLSSIYAADGVEATISSILVAGYYDWTKTGAGTVTLTGDNVFVGKTIVDDGILVAQTPGSLPSYLTSGRIEVRDGAIIGVNMDGTASEWTQADVGNLLTNATFEGGSAVGIDTSNATADVTYGSALDGCFGLTKLGTGTLILSQANTYTGDTTIYDGELQITGLIDSSDVIIKGGLLSGDGSVDDVIVQDGSISPGGSGVDILTMDDLTFETGAGYNVTLDTTSTDKLVATGDIDLGNVTLNLSGTLTSPMAYNVFVLIDNQGADDVVGIFDGLPEGSTVTDGSTDYWITYRYNQDTSEFNTGNDVALIAQGTDLAAPTLSLNDVATSHSQITIDWNDIAGETNYIVQRRTDNSNWADLESCSAGTITYTDDTVTEGTRYYYRVLPTVNDWYTTSSEELCATAKPATPGALAVTYIDGHEITLDWNADNSNNESYYVIQQNTGSGWETIGTAPADSTEVTLDDQSFDPSETYNFQVMAFCEGPGEQYSESSSISGVSISSCPVAPTELTVTEVSGLSVELGWTNHDDNGTTYHVDRKTEGGNWEEITTLGASADEYTDDLSAEGESGYSYRVYASNTTGDSAYSNEVSTGVLAAPTNLSLIAMNDEYVSFSWNDNSFLETSYKIEVSPNGTDSWTDAGEVSYDSNPITNQTCATISDDPGSYTASTDYYFRVSAYSTDFGVASASSTSGAVSYTQTFGETPSNIVATQSTTACQVDVSWNAVDDADDYVVYRVSAATGQSVLLTTTSNTSYLDTGIPTDGGYTYQVIARDTNGDGSNIGDSGSVFAYAANEDFDDDGLTNSEEFTEGTAVDNDDSDGDGLTDGWEVDYDYDPLDTETIDGTPDGEADPDNDHLTNAQEQNAGSEPDEEDSDGDGVSDDEEVAQGSNPNDDSDSTPSSGAIGGFTFQLGDISGSQSETWKLIVTDPAIPGEDNEVASFSASPGEITKMEIPDLFEAGHTYDIDLEWLNGIEDYDWDAYITPGPGLSLPYDIFDKDDLFGDHNNDPDYASKSSQLWIPRMDVTIDNQVIWGDTDDTNGSTTIPAGRYLNIKFASNISDIVLDWGNTKVELEYDEGQVAIYKNPYTLDEIYLDQSYSLSELGAYQDLDGNILIDLYVEGTESLTEATLIEVYADISGSYGGESKGASVYDTVDVFVIDVDTVGDVDVDSDNNDEAGKVEGSDEEDELETKGDAKYIAVQRDTQTGTRLVPVEVSLSSIFGQIDGDFQIQFVCGNNLKLWTEDIGGSNKTNITNTVYTLTGSENGYIFEDEASNTLEFNSNNNQNCIPLYVEATSPGKATIDFQINMAQDGDPDEWVTLDTVLLSAIEETEFCDSCSSNAPDPTGGLTIDDLDIGGSHMMYLLLTGNAIAIVDQCGTTIFDHVDEQGSSYRTTGGESLSLSEGWVYRTTGEESLSLSEVGNTYVCKGPDGTEYIFSSDEESLGKLVEIQYIGAGGFSMFFDENGELLGTISDSGDGTQTETEYTYNADGQIVTETVKINGSTVTVTQFFYYKEDESGGNQGDLKFTTVRKGSDSGPIVDKTYYRYYGKEGDYPGGVKYEYDYASFSRAVKAMGPEADDEDVFAATDEQIDDYATDYYEYNESGQVTSHITQGSGCSLCGGIGGLTYDFSTASATIEDDFNNWKYKKAETASGITTTTYYNYKQQVLLIDRWNGETGAEEQHWYTYNHYDANGNLEMTAHPSAVTGYDGGDEENEAPADLDVTLNAGSGLIDIYQYYTDTDAPDYDVDDLPASGGGVKGYLYRSGVKEGSSGTDQWQTETNYIAKTVDDHTTYYTYQSISHGNAAGTDEKTTTYHYTFFTDTSVPVVKAVETILPVVSAAENGSDVATSSMVVYDKMGRTVWTADAGGYITYTEYDSVSGGVSKQISDVDLTETGDFTIDNLALLNSLSPSWSTPGDGGLHLITTTEYDDFGRVTKQVDPSGSITYTVYNDDQNETRTYHGWDDSTHLPTGAIEVFRTDLADNYSESLTYVYTDPTGLPYDVGTDAPTGTESLTTDPYVTIQSLSRSLMNDAGQATQSRDYFSLDSLNYDPYSTDRDFGTEGTHYLETVTTYDPLGRYAVSESPDGTVTHTFYDRTGRTTETWTGTDDFMGTDYNGDGETDLRDFRSWVADNPNETEGPTGTTSMYLVTETIYDNGLGGGDSLVTESRTYHATDAYYSTFYHYDNQNRTTDILSPGDIVTHYTYDYQGRTTETLTYASDDFTLTSDELRAKSQTSYDSLGRTYETETYEVDPDDGTVGSSVTTETWYNERGYVEQTQNELGKLTTYEYDGLGREIKVTQPDPDGGGAELAPWTIYDYDDAANSLTVTDRLGHDTVYQYDALGRTVSETDANGDTTYYTYDGANLETLTDPEGNATTWVYDLLGRVTEETNELDETHYFEYDSDGYLWQETNRNEQVIQYTYDFQGNTTGELWKDGAATVHEFTFTYDLLGRMLTASDSNAGYVYTYNNAGRLYTETQTLDGLTPTVVLTYTYNDIGLLAQTATTIGGTADAVTDYTYDGFGRLESIQQDDVMGGNAVAEKRVDYTYDAASQYDTITRYADLAKNDQVATGTYGYDFTGRLIALTYTKGVTTLVDHDWVFDAGSNITQYVNSIDGTVDYTNDDTGQLTDADYSNVNIDDESYTYDDNGNRTETTIGLDTDTYTTGDNNQLTSDDTYTYEYDDEGNRTLKYIDADSSGTLNAGDTDITTYDWDYRNRLTTVTHFADHDDYSAPTPDPDQVVDYIYDYKNRLIGKILDDDGDGTTDSSTAFIHDDDQIVAQFDHTGTGDAAASDLSHRYLWGQAVDQILADESVTSLATPGDVIWPLVDHLNTTRDLAEYDAGTDTTSIANHRVFDTYGNLTSETNSAIDCLFAFTARLFDTDTALQNNLNRWYDPTVGRWISQDPIGFDADDANLYRYCSNEVINEVDPLGLKKYRLNFYGEAYAPEDWQSLLWAGFPTRINSLEDLVKRCEAIVDGKNGNSIASITFLAHGGAGSIVLGSDNSSIIYSGGLSPKQKKLLKRLAATLSNDAQIIIAQCDSGTGEEGTKALRLLAKAANCRVKGWVGGYASGLKGCFTGYGWKVVSSKGTVISEPENVGNISNPKKKSCKCKSKRGGCAYPKAH